MTGRNIKINIDHCVIASVLSVGAALLILSKPPDVSKYAETGANTMHKAPIIFFKLFIFCCWYIGYWEIGVLVIGELVIGYRRTGYWYIGYLLIAILYNLSSTLYNLSSILYVLVW